MMIRQEDAEAVIVSGVLEGGMRLEWRPEDSTTIYVGSDPSCQWRVVADGVAAFHWQLCWYGRRLWMAEVGPRRTAGPGSQGWRMAPIGVVLRLGGTVLVIEVATLSAHAALAPAPPSGRSGAADPTLMMHIESARRRGDAPIREPDPDTTLVVDADELRALPMFAALKQPMAQHPPARRPDAARKPAAPSLSEMFIVPAEQVAAASKQSSWLGRTFSSTAARAVLLLVASAGTAAMVFLRDGHAERDEAPALTLPARRPPPETEIEMRGAEPSKRRAEAEAAAGRDLAAGRLEDALRGYRALLEEKPDNRVYRDFVSIIERQVKVRCARGGCKEDAP